MNKIAIYQSKSGISFYSSCGNNTSDTAPIRLSFVVRTGSLDDPKNLKGLAHFVEHMNMAFRKFQLFDFKYSSLSHAYTNYFETVYNITCLECDLPIVCEVLEQLINGDFLRVNRMEEIREDILKEYHRTIASIKYRVNQIILGESIYSKKVPIGTK